MKQKLIITKKNNRMKKINYVYYLINENVYVIKHLN